MKRVVYTGTGRWTTRCVRALRGAAADATIDLDRRIRRDETGNTMSPGPGSAATAGVVGQKGNGV